jgi:hypothetical protein
MLNYIGAHINMDRLRLCISISAGRDEKERASNRVKMRFCTIVILDFSSFSAARHIMMDDVEAPAEQVCGRCDASLLVISL